MKDAEDAMLQRAVALFRERVSIRDAADELGISKSKAERLRSALRGEGLLKPTHLSPSQRQGLRQRDSQESGTPSRDISRDTRLGLS